jgi:hypothetical protein
VVLPQLAPLLQRVNILELAPLLPLLERVDINKLLPLLRGLAALPDKELQVRRAGGPARGGCHQGACL